MDAEWIGRHAGLIAGRAPEDMRALVAVSSPSGDLAGAEAAIAVVRPMLPGVAEIERVPCSTPGHADDFIARVRGAGERRLLLVGHLDTVVPHHDHRPLAADDGRLVGSGAVDMKGGDVLAAGVLRALAEDGPPFAEAVLLLVNDEEWRMAPFVHLDRFRAFDACLCFEAGQLGPEGRRRSSSGARRRARCASARTVARPTRARPPDKGVSALLALARAAEAVAAQHDPRGEDHLTSVPTIIRSGEAFNVVPARGELIADLRAATDRAFQRVIDAVPQEVDGARLEAELLRRWPGMDSRAAAEPMLARAAELLGAPIHAGARGGASDASHLAQVIAVTVDGLGPRGGGAHAPHEHVRVDSLEKRARVALAAAAAALGA